MPLKTGTFLAAGAVLLASAALSGAFVPAGARGAVAVEARLEGAFAMSGRITRARHVLGEHRGQRIARVWSFSPTCPAGPCEQVILTRAREGGASDRVLLRRIGIGLYKGYGVFFVPLRCRRKLNPRGGRVPFGVQVRVLGVQPGPAGPLASSIAATYFNKRRVNRTQCPGGIGADRARYTGTLTQPPAAAGSPPPPASRSKR